MIRESQYADVHEIVQSIGCGKAIFRADASGMKIFTAKPQMSHRGFPTRASLFSVSSVVEILRSMS
jgi:hypothetical protein